MSDFENTGGGKLMLKNSAPERWSRLRELFPVASFSGGIRLSDQRLDLLSKLLHIVPNQRMSAAEALKHSWLVSELP